MIWVVHPFNKITKFENPPGCLFGFHSFLWLRILRILAYKGWFRSIGSQLFPDYELVDRRTCNPSSWSEGRIFLEWVFNILVQLHWTSRPPKSRWRPTRLIRTLVHVSHPSLGKWNGLMACQQWGADRVSGTLLWWVCFVFVVVGNAEVRRIVRLTNAEISRLRIKSILYHAISNNVVPHSVECLVLYLQVCAFIRLGLYGQTTGLVFPLGYLGTLATEHSTLPVSDQEGDPLSCRVPSSICLLIDLNGRSNWIRRYPNFGYHNALRSTFFSYDYRCMERFELSRNQRLTTRDAT